MAAHPSHSSEPSQQAWTLEFVGGPLDGYRYSASFPLDELVPTMAMPVNPNVIRLLAGGVEGKKKPATSVAIYELVRRAAQWRYEHLGAASTDQFQLDSWVG